MVRWITFGFVAFTVGFLVLGCQTITRRQASISEPLLRRYSGNSILPIMEVDGLYENYKFKLWYSSERIASGGIKSDIEYAESVDGVNFVEYPGNPVLIKGSDWESGLIGRPSVLKVNETYYMFYEGRSCAESLRLGGQIGLATSNDGIHWIKSAHNPVLRKGSIGEWDEQIFNNSVFYDSISGIWYMIYEGKATLQRFSDFRLGLATSVDGVHWVKYSGNPIIPPGPPGSWDVQAQCAPYLTKRGNFFYLIYVGRPGEDPITYIGVARSRDAIHWEKTPQNPILKPEAEWEKISLSDPAVIEVHGKTYLYYYGGDQQTIGATGVAISPWSLKRLMAIFFTERPLKLR